MFLSFYDALRAARVPVSLREFLTFLEAMRANLVTHDVEGFYYLARAAMVKDERHIDRFDQAFAKAFAGLETVAPEAGARGPRPAAPLAREDGREAEVPSPIRSGSAWSTS